MAPGRGLFRLSPSPSEAPCCIAEGGHGGCLQSLRLGLGLTVRYSVVGVEVTSAIQCDTVRLGLGLTKLEQQRLK